MANGAAIPIPNSGEVVASSWGAAVAAAHNGIQSGTANVVLANVNGASTAIVFPRPYSAPPLVFVTTETGAAWITVASAVTGNGFTVSSYNRDAGLFSATVPIAWLAIGLP